MKKHLKLVAAVAALIVVATAVVTFEACNKKNEMIDNNSNNHIVSLSSDVNMDEYLLDLRNRMKSAKKGGETMTIADAEWTLTALENFGFCDGSKRSTEMIVDTFYTKIKISDDNVSLYDLNLAYENNKSQIMNKFNSIIGDDKNIYCIMCDMDNSLKEDSAMVKTIVSIRNGDVMENPMRFGPTDYWYDFNEKGKCGDYTGQCVGRDATIEMNSKVLTNLPQYACPNGRVYFTDIDWLDVCTWEYHCPDSPYEDCCFYLNTSDYNRCLSPSDLNWYLDNILGCIDDYESYYNKYITVFELMPGEFLGVKASVPNFWIIYLYLGNIHCTHQPMDD